uniref:Lysine-specific demethylase 7A n=1 Tax=Sphaeramia orbicularis TaxID=375764 RepID=A0A672ZG91_9TELE
RPDEMNNVGSDVRGGIASNGGSRVFLDAGRKMAAAPLYCVCRQPYDVSRFMIECDICKDWFHGSCVQVEEHHAVDIDVYHCPNCDVIHGPSLMKKRNNWHRHDYTEPDDGTKPVQAGTPVFVKELQTRTFASGEEIMMQMKGEQVTRRYLERHGFNYPIVVTEMEGLGLKLPAPTFSVKDVEQYVGGDKVIDVIDVARQADSKMKLSEFVKYYTNPHRPKVLNLISLEFSDTKMSELVEVPDVAQKMSWVENYWPDDSFFPKPFVQKYCLMGVKDSYTDFHIDFGGTSVWYHVLWGEKIFYLIKPTPTNLALYEAWSSSPNQSEVFFGDKVDKCYKCVVTQGTTLLIPTGWIHAVLTSQDCMAFGGNFLHNLNIGMQLRCYEMERRLKTPDLFKFPYFEAICWYVAKNLLETLKELREDNCPPPTYLVEGVKALITALKTWLKREVSEPCEVPDNIRPNHLIKELTKEIRYLEEPGNGSKLVKSQGSGCAVGSGSNGCPATRSTLERLCQARRARRAARRLREQQRQAPKVPSNLDILEQHTREVLKRLEVGPLEEVKGLISAERFRAHHRTGPVWSESQAQTQTTQTVRITCKCDKQTPKRSPCIVVCLVMLCASCRERPTSPSTEEAIQGMLSMAGLLCSSEPEKVASSQEPWWSSPSRCLPLEQREPGERQHRLQGDKSPMDSQGNSSSEAWDNQGLPSPLNRSHVTSPETDYQYCDPSMSPPLHPSKRHAPNPPPISNQATKGKRPKKGMATAKQRLGKILKLNRHSRVFV